MARKRKLLLDSFPLGTITPEEASGKHGIRACVYACVVLAALILIEFLIMLFMLAKYQSKCTLLTFY